MSIENYIAGLADTAAAKIARVAPLVIVAILIKFGAPALICKSRRTGTSLSGDPHTV